jgi:hypothetical protein
MKAKILDDEERHLVLEMTTLRMAHAEERERERENTPAKQRQGKT